jgi:hypothetical protein
MVTNPQNLRLSPDAPRVRLLELSQERGVSLAALS